MCNLCVHDARCADGVPHARPARQPHTRSGCRHMEPDTTDLTTVNTSLQPPPVRRPSQPTRAPSTSTRTSVQPRSSDQSQQQHYQGGGYPAVPAPQGPPPPASELNDMQLGMPAFAGSSGSAQAAGAQQSQQWQRQQPMPQGWQPAPGGTGHYQYQASWPEQQGALHVQPSTGYAQQPPHEGMPPPPQRWTAKPPPPQPLPGQAPGRPTSSLPPLSAGGAPRAWHNAMCQSYDQSRPAEPTKDPLVSTTAPATISGDDPLMETAGKVRSDIPNHEPRAVARPRSPPAQEDASMKGSGSYEPSSGRTKASSGAMQTGELSVGDEPAPPGTAEAVQQAERGEQRAQQRYARFASRLVTPTPDSYDPLEAHMTMCPDVRCLSGCHVQCAHVAAQWLGRQLHAGRFHCRQSHLTHRALAPPPLLPVLPLRAHICGCHMQADDADGGFPGMAAPPVHSQQQPQRPGQRTHDDIRNELEAQQQQGREAQGQGGAAAAQANTLAVQRQTMRLDTVAEPPETHLMSTVYSQRQQHSSSFRSGGENTAAGGAAVGQQYSTPSSAYLTRQAPVATLSMSGGPRLQQSGSRSAPHSSLVLQPDRFMQHASQEQSQGMQGVWPQTSPQQQQQQQQQQPAQEPQPLRSTFASTSAPSTYMPAKAPSQAVQGPPAAYGAAAPADQSAAQWPPADAAASQQHSFGEMMPQQTWQPGYNGIQAHDPRMLHQQPQQQRRSPQESPAYQRGAASGGYGALSAATLLNEAGFHRSRGHN